MIAALGTFSCLQIHMFGCQFLRQCPIRILGQKHLLIASKGSISASNRDQKPWFSESQSRTQFSPIFRLRITPRNPIQVDPVFPKKCQSTEALQWICCDLTKKELLRKLDMAETGRNWPRFQGLLAGHDRNMTRVISCKENTLHIS